MCVAISIGLTESIKKTGFAVINHLLIGLARGWGTDEVETRFPGIGPESRDKALLLRYKDMSPGNIIFITNPKNSSKNMKLKGLFINSLKGLSQKNSDRA